MRLREDQVNAMSRIGTLAAPFLVMLALWLFIAPRTLQGQPGVDSVDLTQQEQVLLQRAIEQSIENLRRYYAQEEYDKVLEECRNLEKLDPGNKIAFYYRSIAQMRQSQKPFEASLGLPSVEGVETSPTRAIAFPRLAPPPALSAIPQPAETTYAGVAPARTEPIVPEENLAERQAPRGQLAASQKGEIGLRERLREMMLHPAARYVMLGAGILVALFIVFQIIQSRKKTRLAIEAAKAQMASRLEGATPAGLQKPPSLQPPVRDEEATEPGSPAGEMQPSMGLFTDVPGLTGSEEQEGIRRAATEAVGETIPAEPEEAAPQMSIETERERLASAIEGLHVPTQPDEEESVGEVELGADEQAETPPKALFSEEDARPSSEQVEVGVQEKKDQVAPAPPLLLGEEEEEINEPEGSMKLDEFLFEGAETPSAPPSVPSDQKPDDASLEAWKRKAYDEDFEKMMFTPGAEDATSIGRTIGEDETLVTPGGKKKPSGTPEPPEKTKAGMPEAAEPKAEPPSGQPPAPRPEDQETMILPERETIILRPSDDESTIKRPIEPKQAPDEEYPSPEGEEEEIGTTSPSASPDELEFLDDLRVAPEETDIKPLDVVVSSTDEQEDVFGKLDLESLKRVEPAEGDRTTESPHSKIMEERSEALFRDQYKKACDAFTQKDWAKAIHYFSVALALKPSDKRVKENLRIARENRKKKLDEK
jgi:hypothetical protein